MSEEVSNLVSSVSSTSELDAIVLGQVQGNDINLLELAEKIDVSVRELRESIARLQAQGYEVHVLDSKVVKLPAPPGERATHIQRVVNGAWLKIGLISDNQLGNKTARLDVLNTAYDHYESEGITDVYHAGNVIDGFLPSINAFELLPDAGPSIERQCAYAATVYPKKPGITTHFVTGDCFSGDTEVLTRTGFKRFDELCQGETPPEGIEVATLNLNTGGMEWQTPTAWFKRALKPGEKMYHFVNQKVDILVSEGHEMLSRARATATHGPGPWEKSLAKDWEPGSQRQFIKSFWGHKGESPETMHGYETRNWVKFMGWYLAEGTSGTRITQSTDSFYLEEIGSLLSDMKIPATCAYEDKAQGWGWSGLPELKAYLQSFGRSWEKFIPEDIKELSPDLLREFIFAYAKGDGNIGDGKAWRKSGHPMYISTTSVRMKDDLMEIGLKAGYGVKTTTLDRGPRMFNGVLAKSARPEHRIYFSRNQFVHYRGHPKILDYQEKIYCVTVPNGAILIRRNGIACVSAQCH